MNKILIIFIVVFITSCSTIKNGNYNINNDILLIYELLEQRISGIDNTKIVIDNKLVFKRFGEYEVSILSNRLHYYNVEIKNEITDYNQNNIVESQKVIGIMTKNKNRNSMYKVSGIGFNKLKDHALVYENDTTRNDLSHGSFLFFEKQKGKWKLRLEILQFDDNNSDNQPLALRAFGADWI